MCKKLIYAKINTDLILTTVEGGKNTMQRLADMGLLPGGCLRILHNSGYGPVTILVKGSKIAIGHGLGSKIIVKEEEK